MSSRKEEYDTKIWYQTAEKLVLRNSSDFVQYYGEKYVPSEASNILIVNLYKTVVWYAGGTSCSSTEYRFRRRRPNGGGQEEIDKRVYGGRGSGVHDAICHYLVRTVVENNGTIPLPLKSGDEGFVKHNDTAAICHDRVYVSNPKILALLLATIFEETEHLRCVDFDSISKIEYGFNCICKPLLNDSTGVVVVVVLVNDDDTDIKKVLDEKIESLDSVQRGYIEKFAKYVLNECEKRRRGSGEEEKDKRETTCVYCKGESEVTYDCSCDVSACFKCLSLRIRYDGIKCCMCKRKVIYMIQK